MDFWFKVMVDHPLFTANVDVLVQRRGGFERRSLPSNPVLSVMDPFLYKQLCLEEKVWRGGTVEDRVVLRSEEETGSLLREGYGVFAVDVQIGGFLLKDLLVGMVAGRVAYLSSTPPEKDHAYYVLTSFGHQEVQAAVYGWLEGMAPSGARDPAGDLLPSGGGSASARPVPEKLVNLTSRELTLLHNGGALVLPKEGLTPRVQVVPERFGDFSGVPLYIHYHKGVRGLPPPLAGVGYVVSPLIAGACPDRDDLFVPTHPVKDDNGRVEGYGSLTTKGE